MKNYLTKMAIMKKILCKQIFLQREFGPLAPNMVKA